jgi:arylsulfatase A-like enzyme
LNNKREKNLSINTKLNDMKNLVIIILVTAVSCVQVFGQRANHAGKTKQPNIIFILTDDLGFGDVGTFFQNQRKQANDRSKPFTSTPNIDRLAASGAKLPQHYCAAPVCAPARASLLLGVHQGHANVRDNQFDKALEDNYTIASVLRSVGYKTAVFGKWGLQGLNNEGPDWPAHPLNRGFDYFMGMIRHADGHEHYPKEGIYRGTKQVWENKTNIADKLDKCYTADLWTASAKKWIIENKQDKKTDQPFFIYLAYETPHAVLELPTQAFPAGGGIKGGVQWLGKAGHMINTASGKVDSYIHPEYANATYDHDNDAKTPEIAWPDVYKRYATAVRRIDSEVDDLLQLLKDLKIDENTLVVFSSDNGPSIESYLKENFEANFFESFGPFDGIKRDVWEGGVRVPTIAAWPGHIRANTVISTPSGVHDWLPTFLDAAGALAPVRTDGVSLMPSLTGKGKQLSSTIYIEYFQNQSTPNFKEFDASHRNRKRNQMQMIRFGDTVGVRYDIKTHNDDFEIYNVMKDPQETNNLANKKGQNLLQSKMKERVLQVRRPDTSAPRPYDKELISPATVIGARPGFHWQSYHASFPWIADVTARSTIAKGIAQQPVSKLAADGDLILLTGFIQVPADGEYTFSLSSNAGSFLRIHDAIVIDEDYGYKSSEERLASMRLKAGLHPFKLYCRVKKSSAHLLDFTWQGPGLAKQPIWSSIRYN